MSDLFPNLPDFEATVRSQYLLSLRQIAPADDREVADIEATLRWLESERHVHKPQNMNEHLGVMCLILSPDRRRTFLLNHRKAETWLPPGGHVDLGLSFERAIRLEVEEELGKPVALIRPDPFFLVRVLTRGLNAGHIDVTAWFLGEGDPNFAYHIQEKEASDSAWFEVEDLPSMPDHSNLPRVYRKLSGMRLEPS